MRFVVNFGIFADCFWRIVPLHIRPFLHIPTYGGCQFNTTMQILSVRGVPHRPFSDKIFVEKGVTDMGVPPPTPPLGTFFQDFLLKMPENCVFAQQTPFFL